MRRLAALAALLTALLLIRPSAHHHAPSSSPPATPGPTPALLQPATDIPGPGRHTVQAAPSSIPARTWPTEPPTPATDRDYLRSATGTPDAVAHPRVARDQWWPNLIPWLSADALFAYQGTDPDAVGYRRVTGPARMTSRPGPDLAVVTIPTDTGPWTVSLRNDHPAGVKVTAAHPTRQDPSR